MRRVIDDTHLTEVADAVYEIIQEIRPADVSEYDYGQYRAQVHLICQYIKRQLDLQFGTDAVTFGETTHLHGIGNNNEIELVFHTSTEQQICGRLCLTDDMYGSVICWIEDIDRHTLTQYPSRKIHGENPKRPGYSW